MCSPVPLSKIFEYFFGEDIMVAMGDYYQVPSHGNLRAVIDFWFTFRAAGGEEDDSKPPSCPGCARKAQFQSEIVEVYGTNI
jgi:hypothetical protein